MISNLRISGVNLVVVALFAVAGFVAVCWVAAGWAERAADWLRDRRDATESGVPVSGFRRLREWARRDRVTPLLEDDDELTGLPPGIGLPPERTWEQMTSHQLPLVDGIRGVESAGIVREHEPWRVEAHLSAVRERRAPWWEAEHRAAYESLGFDYPSGLMARVREAGVRPTQADVSRWIAKLGPTA